MNQVSPPDIYDLHGYVDDQLSSDERERVEAYLAASPDEQQRVDEYRAIREGLKELYDPVAAEPVPPALLPTRNPAKKTIYAAAAGILLLLTGGGIGWHLKDYASIPVFELPDVVRETAMAYAVYSPEVRHPVEVPGDQEEHLGAWLSKRMGTQMRIPQLESLGFRLVGGRLLASADGPGGLLMYENSSGSRVVLYACRNEEQERNTAFRYASESEASVFYWIEGSLSYGLAGELERGQLRELAESAYRQIAI